MTKRLQGDYSSVLRSKEGQTEYLSLPDNWYQACCDDGFIFGQNADSVTKSAQVQRCGHNLTVVHLWHSRRSQSLLEYFQIQRIDLQARVSLH